MRPAVPYVPNQYGSKWAHCHNLLTTAHNGSPPEPKLGQNHPQRNDAPGPAFAHQKEKRIAVPLFVDSREHDVHAAQRDPEDEKAYGYSNNPCTFNARLKRSLTPNLLNAEPRWRSEERRVGKECRSGC